MWHSRKNQDFVAIWINDQTQLWDLCLGQVTDGIGLSSTSENMDNICLYVVFGNDPSHKNLFFFF